MKICSGNKNVAILSVLNVVKQYLRVALLVERLEKLVKTLTYKVVNNEY
jgi:hypothetical protein